MNYVFHHTSYVAMTLREVQLSKFRRSLVQAGMSCEDRATALTLISWLPLVMRNNVLEGITNE